MTIHSRRIAFLSLSTIIVASFLIYDVSAAHFTTANHRSRSTSAITRSHIIKKNTRNRASDGEIAHQSKQRVERKLKQTKCKFKKKTKSTKPTTPKQKKFNRKARRTFVVENEFYETQEAQIVYTDARGIPKPKLTKDSNLPKKSQPPSSSILPKDTVKAPTPSIQTQPPSSSALPKDTVKAPTPSKAPAAKGKGTRPPSVAADVNKPSKPPAAKGKGTKPPSGNELDEYEDYYEGGKKDDNFDYIYCEQPSTAPSISFTPSLSSRPSASPTLSVMPSPKPSVSPSEVGIPKSQGCKTIKEGEVYETDRPLKGEYYYEMITNTADMDKLLKDLDRELAALILPKLVWCGFSGRRMTHLEGIHRDLEDYHIIEDGIDIDGLDLGEKDVVADGYKCEKLEPNVTEACAVYKGNFIAYVDEDSSATDEQVQFAVYTTVKNAMNDGDLARKVMGAEEILFGGGSQQFVDERGVGTNRIIGEDNENTNAGLSAMGIGIIASGVGVVLLFLFVFARRRESIKHRSMEQMFEDDEDIFKDIHRDNGTELMGYGPHILGELDSICSDDFDIKADKQRIYGMGNGRNATGPEEGNIGARGDALDVHQCNSATCEICLRMNNLPSFVSSNPGTPTFECTPTNDRQYHSANTVEI